MAAVHLPLHYTDSPSAHPLLSFPILSIWFVHLRSSAAALCRAAAQREAPGARLESPSSTGSQRMFQLICFVPVDTKIKTNKVKQYIYFHYLLEVNSSWCSGSSSSGKQTWIHFGVEKKRKDKYAAFQGTTTAFPDPPHYPIDNRSGGVGVDEVRQKDLTGRHLMKKKGRFLHLRSTS